MSNHVKFTIHAFRFYKHHLIFTNNNMKKPQISLRLSIRSNLLALGKNYFEIFIRFIFQISMIHQIIMIFSRLKLFVPSHYNHTCNREGLGELNPP